MNCGLRGLVLAQQAADSTPDCMSARNDRQWGQFSRLPISVTSTLIGLCPNPASSFSEQGQIGTLPVNACQFGRFFQNAPRFLVVGDGWCRSCRPGGEPTGRGGCGIGAVGPARVRAWPPLGREVRPGAAAALLPSHPPNTPPPQRPGASASLPHSRAGSRSAPPSLSPRPPNPAVPSHLAPKLHAAPAWRPCCVGREPGRDGRSGVLPARRGPCSFRAACRAAQAPHRHVNCTASPGRGRAGVCVPESACRTPTARP